MTRNFAKQHAFGMVPWMSAAALALAATLAEVTSWDTQSHASAPSHYGLLWWNNADGALDSVPRDAYWAWGLYDSLIVVIPSLDLVAVRGGARGRSWQHEDDWGHYQVLEPFLGNIVAADTSQPLSRLGGSRGTSGEGDQAKEAFSAQHQSSESPPLADVQPSRAGGWQYAASGKLDATEGAVRFVATAGAAAPYPPSPLISDVRWAPKDEIFRLARGSDNWPLTWADDGHLYTGYRSGSATTARRFG